MRVFLLASLLLAASGCAGDAAPSPVSDEGSDAPAGPGADLTLVEVASAEALVDDLDTLDAEIVVLNFWATWCGPCREEFPEFIQFDRERQDDGIHVRFVSLDQAVDLPMVRAFLAEHDVTDPSYFYVGQGELTRELNPFVGSALPTTMVLNGDGILQHTHVGRMTYADLAATVDSVRTNPS